jgi:hypothetical protein
MGVRYGLDLIPRTLVGVANYEAEELGSMTMPFVVGGCGHYASSGRSDQSGYDKAASKLWEDHVAALIGTALDRHNPRAKPHCTAFSQICPTFKNECLNINVVYFYCNTVQGPSHETFHCVHVAPSLSTPLFHGVTALASCRSGETRGMSWCFY